MTQEEFLRIYRFMKSRYGIDMDLAEGSSVAEDKGETVKNIIIPEPNTVADAGAVTVPEDKPPVSGTESASGKEEPAKAEEPLTQQVSSAGSSVEGEQEETSKEVNEVLSFSAENGLLWPVNGSVVMNYSADHVIYHATLREDEAKDCLTNDEVLANSKDIKANQVKVPKVVN